MGAPQIERLRIGYFRSAPVVEPSLRCRPRTPSDHIPRGESPGKREMAIGQVGEESAYARCTRGDLRSSVHAASVEGRGFLIPLLGANAATVVDEAAARSRVGREVDRGGATAGARDDHLLSLAAEHPQHYARDSRRARDHKRTTGGGRGPQRRADCLCTRDRHLVASRVRRSVHRFSGSE